MFAFLYVKANSKKISEEVSFLALLRKMLMSAFLLGFKATYLENSVATSFVCVCVDSKSPCKDILFPRGPNLAQKPSYLVGTVLNGSLGSRQFLKAANERTSFANRPECRDTSGNFFMRAGAKYTFWDVCSADADQFVKHVDGLLEQQRQDGHVCRRTRTFPPILRKNQSPHYKGDEVKKTEWNSWHVIDVKMNRTKHYRNLWVCSARWCINRCLRQKLDSIRFLDSLRRRPNARSVSFRISLRWPIGLIRDYVTCSKFTTKPRLCGICSNFRCPHVVFTWVFFLCWLFWELAQEKNLHFALSKRGLVVILAGLMSSHIRAIVFTFCKFSLDFCLIIRWYRKWSSLSFSKKNRRESV